MVSYGRLEWYLAADKNGILPEIGMVSLPQITMPLPEQEMRVDLSRTSTSLVYPARPLALMEVHVLSALFLIRGETP